MTIDSLLSEAHRWLDAGQGHRARELATQSLAFARAGRDPHAEAKSLLCLAHGDRLVSRHRDAHRASQRAAHLFRKAGDVAGEVNALTTVAHTAANLGRSEEAVEVALLAVRLAQSLPVGPLHVLACNYLGVAHFLAKDHAKGEAAFERALALAARCTPAVNTFQVRCNQLWSEGTRLFFERDASGRMPAVGRMAMRHQACAELMKAGAAGALTEGQGVSTHANWHFTTGLLACWQGDLDRAEAEADAGREWARRYGVVTWLDVQEAWVRTEAAWARRDWPRADDWVERMAALAVQAEHEEFACASHLLAAQLRAARGDHRGALDELRRLRRREQQIRIESLASRERVVQWQLDVRRTEVSLRAEQNNSRRFAQLAGQDALTGIANRRRFEERLGRMLAARRDSREPLCVALIDVDRFKSVNDGFSHQAGDDVLRTLADLFVAEVRADDLAARLAGDEFVLILAGADLGHAERICERVRQGVERFPWAAIAPGLQVTVSVGAAQAQDDDSIESLLHRSDAAMYAVKRSRGDRAAADAVA